MDRAGTDDDEEAIIASIQDGLGSLASGRDQLRGRLSHGQLIRKDRWRNERVDAVDAEVVGISGSHGRFFDGFLRNSRVEVCQMGIFGADYL